MVGVISKELQAHVINGGFIHCRDIHDHSCLVYALLKFFTIVKLSAKFYLPIHTIPTLIFRRHLILKK